MSAPEKITPESAVVLPALEFCIFAPLKSAPLPCAPPNVVREASAWLKQALSRVASVKSAEVRIA